jgi:hypothetical protein
VSARALVVASRDDGARADDGRFALPAPRAWDTLRVHAEGDEVLRALVAPDDDDVALSPASTAVSIVVDALRADDADLDLRRARAIAEDEAAVAELASLLEAALSVDPRALAHPDDVPGLSHKRIFAEQAVRARL